MQSTRSPGYTPGIRPDTRIVLASVDTILTALARLDNTGLDHLQSSLDLKFPSDSSEKATRRWKSV